MKNLLLWCDIMVSDLDRASDFYARVFNIELTRMSSPAGEVAMMPFAPDVASACLRTDDNPSRNGSVPYFSAGDDMQATLDRVVEAGGEVDSGRISMGDHGYMAYIRDLDGNRIGLHNGKG